jgi:cytochrome c oxidase subunit II
MDLLFTAISAVAVFFSAAIFITIIAFAVRYRVGSRVDRSHPPLHNIPVELAWTIIPLGIAMGIFAWATSLYFHNVRVPPGAMEIHVVGKQWMWKLQHPSGRWENNTLHVPAGRAVKLTMTSEDVIHSFYVPAFRLKQDVIPGQFTQMWFTPTTPGEYHLFCAEFCGTLHSSMVGTVYVMDPKDYETWLSEGNVRQSAAMEGSRLFRRHGCSGCHGANSSVRAPLLEGIFGKPVPVQIAPAGVPAKQLASVLANVQAQTLIADTRYIHDSIVLPEKEIAAGYKPIMPSFKNRLTEEEVFNLVAYIRTLGEARQTGTGRQDYTNRVSPGSRQDNTGNLTAEDYRARTGFVPDNVGGGNTPGTNERTTR